MAQLTMVRFRRNRDIYFGAHRIGTLDTLGGNGCRAWLISVGGKPGVHSFFNSRDARFAVLDWLLIQPGAKFKPTVGVPGVEDFLTRTIIANVGLTIAFEHRDSVVEWTNVEEWLQWCERYQASRCESVPELIQTGSSVKYPTEAAFSD